MNSNYFHKNFPLLYAYIGTEGNQYEYNEDKIGILSDKYCNLLNSKCEFFPNGSVYLNSKLHDSWVNSIEETGNNITIWLNDFQTHCFSDAICDVYKENIPHKKRIFPIGIQLNEIKASNISWINKNNKLIPLNQKKYLSKLSEILFDEAISIEPNKIKMGFLFMTNCHSFSNKSTVLFQVECESMTFIDNQKESFINLFSGNYTQLFENFWEKRLEGENFDYSNSLELIKKTEQSGSL